MSNEGVHKILMLVMYGQSPGDGAIGYQHQEAARRLRHPPPNPTDIVSGVFGPSPAKCKSYQQSCVPYIPTTEIHPTQTLLERWVTISLNDCDSDT